MKLQNSDSVLEDLKKALAPRLRGVKSLWTTFDTYCVEDSSQQPCQSQPATRIEPATVINNKSRLERKQFQKILREIVS